MQKSLWRQPAVTCTALVHGLKGESVKERRIFLVTPTNPPVLRIRPPGHVLEKTAQRRSVKRSGGLTRLMAVISYLLHMGRGQEHPEKIDEK